MDDTGRLIDEVMMVLHMAVEDDGSSRKGVAAKQTFLDEEVQCVVDGGSRHHREFLAHSFQDFFRRGVTIGVEHELTNGDSLSRWIDAVLFEQCCGLSGH